MDVGKYFFGSYTMENMVKPVRHSYIAGKILMKLVVARLIQPEGSTRGFKSIKVSINEDEVVRGKDNFVENDPTPGIYESSMVFGVVAKVEHIKNVYHVGFGNSKTQMKMFFPGTEMLGRHYIVNSMQNQVCRYYTICNSMHTKVFPQYISCFDSVLEGKEISREFESFRDICDAWDDKLELVMKFYRQSKNGITKQLLSDNKEDRFFISGPLSRGYDLTKSNMKGTTLIFVGGTGVLPFMDVFAYMARRIIHKNDPSKEVFPGEKFEDELEEANFVVYGFFPRAADACAFDFCKKTSEIHEKYKAGGKFKFIPKFTRDGDKRLDQEQMFEILNKHHESTGIKNLWICGPPPMNNMFQEYRRNISNEFGLSHTSFEIL